jgi:hypothetical protein
MISVHEWTTQAKCRDLGSNRRDRDLMFPSPRNGRQIARAKRFCQGCPVARQCLRDGDGDGFSVRAGLTGDERRRLQQGTKVAACDRCQLPFVPRPANPTHCTGCTSRFQHEIRPEDFKDEILAMHHDGASGEQISLYFGFSRDEIRAAGQRWRIGLMRRPAPDCGTSGALRRHWLAGEQPCERCLSADRERRRAARKQQRQQRESVAA